MRSCHEPHRARYRGDERMRSVQHLAQLPLQLSSFGSLGQAMGEERMDLRVALKALGEKTKLGNLTPKKVGDYFESDAVVKSRSGKPKNERTIAKTRRVLRMALEWAEKKGFVDKAPIPAKIKSA